MRRTCRSIPAVDRVLAPQKRESRDAHRVVRRAAGNDARQVRVILAHLFGRGPCRAQVLAADGGLAEPPLALAPDGNWIPQRLTCPDHEIKAALRSSHDDRSGLGGT